MDLSIIIVNYKSAQLVLDCIQSIEASKMQISYEIIIVDNASNDDSKEKILSIYPTVSWIQSTYNAGFARANNMGIQNAKGEYILLLNSDTLIIDKAIEETVLRFKADKAYSACGVQLLNVDGTNQFSGAKFVRGGINHFLPLPYMGELLKKFGIFLGINQHNIFSVDNDIEVDWIVGAFIMTRRSVIEKAGLLDEDFFMYAEEVEWCSRIRRISPLIIYNHPKVIHIGGGSSSVYYKNNSNENFSILQEKKGKQIILSHLLRIRKQYGITWFLIHVAVYLIEIPFFGICTIIDKLYRRERSNYNFSQWILYVKNIFNLIPYIPSIAINKKMFYKA